MALEYKSWFAVLRRRDRKRGKRTAGELRSDSETNTTTQNLAMMSKGKVAKGPKVTEPTPMQKVMIARAAKEAAKHRDTATDEQGQGRNARTGKE